MGVAPAAQGAPSREMRFECLPAAGAQDVVGSPQYSRGVSMRKGILGAAALACWMGAAVAAGPNGPAASRPDISLSVYNNDLVLVRDVRTIDVPAGRNRVELEDVAASIRPETVSLRGEGLTVVEQNFDYDLLTPAKMMEKAVGHQVQVVRTIPGTGRQTTETATVLSVNNGVILKIGNRIEVLRDDSIPARVVFSSIPENLRPKPTLSVIVDAAAAGPRQVTLSYLATGVSWSASYVGMFDEAQGTMGVQGWITIKNRSGTGFRDADAQMIAGAMNVTGGDQDYSRASAARVTAGTGDNANAPRAADYYAYRLPERMSVANEQSKQVAFLDLTATNAVKSYAIANADFRSDNTAKHAMVTVRFSNPGKALPAGTIRVYMHDDRGESKFVGESALGHTPAGSGLLVELGEAFDVTAQRTLLANEKTRTGTRYAVSYVLRNARAETVTVTVRQGGLRRDGKVDEESLPSRRRDADTLEWSVPVPAHGEATLTFTVETGS